MDEVEALLRGRGRNYLDAKPLQLLFTTVERGLRSEDDDGSLSGALRELALRADRQMWVQHHAGYTGRGHGKIPGRKHRVVRAHGVRPDQNRPRLGPEFVGPQPRVFARNPPAVTTGGGDPAVEGGGELEVDERPPGLHVVEELFVLSLERRVV